MNPKDMTNKHLIDSVCEAISICDLDAANKFQQELLCRLDALRKENEELRKQIQAIEEPLILGFDLFFSNGCKYRAGFPSGYCIRQYTPSTTARTHRVVGYGETLSECISEWRAWRDSSAKAKESEASHAN